MDKRQSNATNSTRAGYSLLSVAAAMLVFGLLGASAISLYSAKENQDRIQQNKDIQTALKKSLREFRSKNGHYPCPSDPHAAIDTPAAGVSVPGCSGGGLISTTAPGGAMVMIGSIPTRTLNIDDKLGFDAWGSRVVYALTKLYSSAPVPGDDGAISVIDSAGNHLTTRPGNAIYVILLPGDDKRGYFDMNGGPAPILACDTSVASGENCNNDSVFYSNLYSNHTDTNQKYTASIDFVSGHTGPPTY